MTNPYALLPFQKEHLVEEILPATLHSGFAYAAEFFTDEQVDAFSLEAKRFRSNPIRNAFHRLDTGNPLTPSIHSAFVLPFADRLSQKGFLSALLTVAEGTPLRRLPAISRCGFAIEAAVRAYGETVGYRSVAEWRFGRAVLMDYEHPDGQLGVAQRHVDSNMGLRFTASLGPALMSVGEDLQYRLEDGDLTAYVGLESTKELGVRQVPHAVMALGPRQAVRFDSA